MTAKQNEGHEKVKPLTPVTELLGTVGVLSFSNNQASVGCRFLMHDGSFWSLLKCQTLFIFYFFLAEFAERELETDLRSISSPIGVSVA